LYKVASSFALLVREVAPCYLERRLKVSDSQVPWYPLAEIQRLVRDGERYFGTLAARQMVERGYAAGDVWECILEMDTGCFAKSGVSHHPLHVGERWDAYKCEFRGRRTWFELTIDASRQQVKLISVHPSK